MEREKEQRVVNFSTPQNPVQQLQVKFKELESGFKAWLAKQSLPVETAVITAISSVQGAAIGALMGSLTKDVSAALPNPANLEPQAMAAVNQAQALAGGPLIQARNFAVMTGVSAGISTVMKRLRGKEDVQTNMVAAFGSGVMYSFVSGIGSGGNPAINAVTSGLFFALGQGGLFWAGKKFSQPPAEDIYYAKTRSLLRKLGLQNYENNFKTGLLTDSTLPLLTDSALRDVKIPPGPRLLILDHIDRDPELSEVSKQ